MSFDMSDYKTVAERMVDFFQKHPEGTLQQYAPPSLMTVGGKDFVVYHAAAYRTPDDSRPGIGTAWEPVPGKTQFTRDSELMNAETSAWGRAILAVGASDTKQGIASKEEVENRQDTKSASKQPPVDRVAQFKDLLTMRGLDVTNAFAVACGLTPRFDKLCDGTDDDKFWTVIEAMPVADARKLYKAIQEAGEPDDPEVQDD